MLADSIAFHLFCFVSLGLGAKVEWDAGLYYPSLVRSPAVEYIIQLFLFVDLLLLPQKSVKKDHYIRRQMVLVGRKLLLHLLVMSC